MIAHLLASYRDMLLPGVIEYGKHTGLVDAAFVVDWDAGELRLVPAPGRQGELIVSADELVAMRRADLTALAIDRVRSIMLGSRRRELTD